MTSLFDVHLMDLYLELVVEQVPDGTAWNWHYHAVW
jgi:hypothetical protein